jgi:ferredoxin
LPDVLRVRLRPVQIQLQSLGDERLLDCLDEHAIAALERGESSASGVPLSCRGARCASCRVRVVHGAELLAPAGPVELDTLRLTGAAPDERLACQIWFQHGEGEIDLEFTALTGGG